MILGQLRMGARQAKNASLDNDVIILMIMIITIMKVMTTIIIIIMITINLRSADNNERLICIQDAPPSYIKPLPSNTIYLYIV